MAMPVVFMFSGQGSQYYHMGRELYEKHSGFRKWMNEFNQVALDVFGTSIVDKIYDERRSKADSFMQTLDTSPAIIMVELAMARVLIESGLQPDYLLGASLGEVSSGLVADVFNLREAFTELFERLGYFEEHCERGKMIGILESPALYENTPDLNRYSEIAGYNFDSHFVISCKETYVRQIEGYLTRNGIVFQTLPVSLGFHSSLLDTAESYYKTVVNKTSYRAPRMPFVSCTHAREIDALDIHYFWNIFRQPIQFQKTILALEARGDYCYIDLGPSGTLANFVKYNLRRDSKSAVFPLLTPFGQDLKNLDIIQEYISNPKS